MKRRLSDPHDGTEVDWLAERCAEEACCDDRRDICDGRAGHQLFRRALVGRDQRAWAALARAYGPALARWARTHRLYAAAGEEAEALANQALARLWRRVGPATFDAFPTLRSLLGYLRRCVHAAVIDAARQRARERRRMQALAETLASREPWSPPGWALDRAQAGELWTVVRAHCRTAEEELVAYDHLVLGMTPGDLLALHPALFASTRAINAARANLLRRLRRSPALRRERQEIRAS
jgi:DNA-directed RNA polymerase specialized sigma24 family protein